MKYNRELCQLVFLATTWPIYLPLMYVGLKMLRRNRRRAWQVGIGELAK